MTSTGGSRRERAKRDKATRILVAAAELFSSRGFEQTTMHQVASAAGVADGTVFLYADTKVELLLMVINEEFRVAVAAGIAADERRRSATAVADRMSIDADARARIHRLLEPIVAYTLANQENARRYQRELLFGGPGGVQRARGIALTESAITAIASVLARQGSGEPPTPDALLAARLLFAGVIVDLAGIPGSPSAATQMRARLEMGIRLTVRGYLASRAEEPTAMAPADDGQDSGKARETT